MSTRILVTGGAGFIGSHVCEALLERRYAVRVLDNFSTGHREWIPAGTEVVEGDITDRPTCYRSVDGCHGVLHLAAMARSGPSLELIDLCQEQNIQGTLNLLQASRDRGVRRFVYSASSTHYGNQPTPHTPDAKPDLLNPYGLSKHVGELWTLMFARNYGLSALSLRYFNVYGPRQPETGPYGLVIGLFLRARQQGLPLTIHGSGAQRRDFVHVRDVAQCNLAALESAVSGQALNVGSGTNVSIQELADLISDAQVHTDRRPGDAEETLADIRLTRQLLGWEPRIPFEAGIGELLR